MSEIHRKIGIVAGAGVLGLSSLYLIRKWLNRTRKVATVKSLTVYPVKCCGGVDVEEISITKNGGVVDVASNVMDRSFIVIDSEKRTMNARTTPALRSIRTWLEPGCLRLRSDSLDDELSFPLPFKVDEESEPVTIAIFNRKVEVIDCGEEAAKWFSAATGRLGARLVHLPADRLIWGPASDENVKKFKIPFKDDKVALQNLSPVNLVSQESLDDADEHMPEGMNVDRHNFRPNIVVVDVDKPYSEDTWSVLHVGDAVLYHGRPCSRCPQTTVVPVNNDDSAAPQYTARSDNEPLTTLRKFRLHTEFRKPTISVDLGVTRDGRVRVGDTVSA